MNNTNQHKKTQTAGGDPVGQAILDYARHPKPADIIVSSDMCDDDIIPVEVLFRSYEEMPELEQMALEACTGKVLDVGAGAGVHARYLLQQKLEVQAIDISPGAVEYMKNNGIPARNINFFDLKAEQYDTILMLMNGIGIAGKLSRLEATLRQAWDLLAPGGSLICDSSDVKYLYEDEDGSLWIDLNNEYYGNFKFNMSYRKEKGTWFDWLYVDFDHLFETAGKVGFKTIRMYEKDDHYLAKLTKP